MYIFLHHYVDRLLTTWCYKTAALKLISVALKKYYTRHVRYLLRSLYNALTKARARAA